jgi:anti-sigma factor (TIGR02949 family)
MNPCQDRETLLQALVDGELDAANALALEAHLSNCAGCSEHVRLLQALRARLSRDASQEPAPPALRASIEAMIETEARSKRGGASRRWWAAPAAGWSTAGAMAALAAGFLFVQFGPMQTASLQDEMVASHIRSLEANHLIDVATSDRHVVKPWFNGKIDFAPPVVDLADQGFPLAGGRLDYADGREIAALVYRRRAHVINLFVLPARARPLAWFAHVRRTSYAVIHWTRGGLDYWAVSDVEPGELERFHAAFAARTPG